LLPLLTSFLHAAPAPHYPSHSLPATALAVSAAAASRALERMRRWWIPARDPAAAAAAWLGASARHARSRLVQAATAASAAAQPLLARIGVTVQAAKGTPTTGCTERKHPDLLGIGVPCGDEWLMANDNEGDLGPPPVLRSFEGLFLHNK